MKSTHFTDNKILKFMTFFNIMYLYVFTISILDIGLENALNAFSRILFTTFFFYISFRYVNTWARYEMCLKIYLIIILIAAGSLLYQNLFGELFWLQDIKSRGGVFRYASILGSMTVYGVAVGFAFLILPVLNIKYFLKVVSYFCLSVGVLLTLQKSAIANLIISTFLIIYISNINLFNFKIFCSLSLLLFGFISIIYFNFYEHIIVLKNFLGIASEDEKLWVGHGFINNFLDRLTPSHFSTISYTDFIFGVGFRGLGGAVGIEGEMGHNGILDILAMGGFLMLFTFIYIKIFIFYKVYKNTILSIKQKRFLLSFLFIYIVNFPMFSGMLVNPSLVIPLFLTFAYIANLKKYNPKNYMYLPIIPINPSKF